MMIELAFFGSLDELDKHQLCKLIAYRMSKHDIKQPLRFLLKWYNIFDLLEKKKTRTITLRSLKLAYLIITDIHATTSSLANSIREAFYKNYDGKI